MSEGSWKGLHLTQSLLQDWLPEHNFSKCEEFRCCKLQPRRFRPPPQALLIAIRCPTLYVTEHLWDCCVNSLECMNITSVYQ